jgi:hypothetical protein
MRFLKIVCQTSRNLFLFFAAVGATHLIGAAGLLAGGPLLALAGYFICITLMLSVLAWAVERS